MKGLILVALMSFAVVACSSETKPDPDNGVSTASYRQCLERVDTNVAQITSKLIELKALDQPQPIISSVPGVASQIGPLHSPEWWDAEILQGKQTALLIKATLKGASQ